MQNEIITDSKLIKNFIKNIKRIKFINNEGTINEFKIIEENLITIKKQIQNSSNDTLEMKNLKDVFKIWENLLKSAIIFFKTKDQREGNIHDKETYGIESLMEYLKQFKEHERVLYSSKEFYREHIFHMFRTFLLGEYICYKYLNGFASIKINDIERLKRKLIKKNKKKDEEKINNFFNSLISNEEKEAMWCLIALTHDLGYPLEYAHKINDPMRKMMKYFGRMNIQEFGVVFPPQSRFIDNFITQFTSSRLETINDNVEEIQYTTEVQTKYYLKFSKEFEEYKHGIVTCVLLMKNLVYFLESDYVMGRYSTLNEKDGRQFLIRREILRAIAAHCCDEIYHLSVTNLPFLLIICDEMQSWDRPFFSEKFAEDIPKNTELSINKINSKLVDFEIKWEEKDDKNGKCNIYYYGRDLGKKFIKVLRSGVDSEHRDFEFRFTLKYYVKKNQKIDKIFGLRFIHKKPISNDSIFYDVKIQELHRTRWNNPISFEDFEKKANDHIKEECNK